MTVFDAIKDAGVTDNRYSVATDGQATFVAGYPDDQRAVVEQVVASYDPDAGPTLADLKAEAVARLQAAKWERLRGTYRDSHGHLYAIDADSWSLLSGEVAILGAAGRTLETGYAWKTAEVDAQGEPVYVPHDAESLIALALEIRAYINAVFRASEAAQAAVRAATDAAGVTAAEAGVVWP